MCDEFTAANGDAADSGKRMTRREFAAAGAVAALAGYAPAATAAVASGTLAERSVEVTTPDGACDAFFVHPAKGAHPGVILWPDALGLRDAKKIMARRLAAEGYAVLAVNQYYRSTRAPLGLDFAAFRTPEGRARIMPLMASLTPDATERDAKAFVAWLDAQPPVDTRRGIGAEGYCMGGAMTVRSAHAVPARIKAGASFHGGGLVTDKPDSPHKLLPTTQASYLIAIARDDDAKSPSDKDTLRKAADEARRPAEIEVYAGDHGWCVPDAPAYNKAEADRAWARLLALYSKL